MHCRGWSFPGVTCAITFGQWVGRVKSATVTFIERCGICSGTVTHLPTNCHRIFLQRRRVVLCFLPERSKLSQTNPQYSNQLWDVAIIGAGMGGGFSASALAEAGHDVLLIDRGNEEISPPAAIALLNGQEAQLAESRWPTMSAFEIDGVVNRCRAPFGAGVGGSTNLVCRSAGTFRQPGYRRRSVAHPTGGWPISYHELLPYYERAERMLHVSGTIDPLSVHTANHIREPPPLGPWMLTSCNSSRRVACIRIDSTSVSDTCRTAMNALADYAIRIAGQTSVPCSPRLTKSQLSWLVAKWYDLKLCLTV